MTEQDKIITPGEIVFDDNSKETKSWSCLGQTRSRSSIEFLSQLLWFYWFSSVAFGEFIFEKIVLNQLVG